MTTEDRGTDATGSASGGASAANAGSSRRSASGGASGASRGSSGASANSSTRAASTGEQGTSAGASGASGASAGASGASGASAGASGASSASARSGAAGRHGATPANGQSNAPAGPSSILVCPNCGKKNRIGASAKGTPHCGSCDASLPWVVDATDQTFEAEALSSVAVVVDLWAPWCGPCRFVSPILEDLAREYAGRLKVVKVNVDENPRLAATFDARSIPTLMVIQGGRVVDRIVGAMPKPDLTVRLTPYLLRRSA